MVCSYVEIICHYTEKTKLTNDPEAQHYYWLEFYNQQVSRDQANTGNSSA